MFVMATVTVNLMSCYDNVCYGNGLMSCYGNGKFNELLR